MDQSESMRGSRLYRRQALAAVAGAAGWLMAGTAGAQTTPRSEAELARERQLRDDFPNLARYAEDNARIVAAGIRPTIVFMGDSITEGWNRLRPEFFTPRRICRGISGQTTPQMVLRMMPDVIALRPMAVHIMAGTNDIAGNTGPMTLAQSRDNIAAMAILAKAQGVRVLIGSVPPAAAFRWRPEKRPANDIVALNAMLRALSRRLGADWIDYHAALATPEGGMREGLARDGVHPLVAGYEVMERVLAPHLARVERGRR
ncbi:GDSL-type esterase/lipase family protein [Sphingomonas sp.]|uniref:GDSL-type esterase/lipase family protein n=1 Tax=Sphingomonas sp. TaxID=28214 RepID=UPI001EC36BB6|nr:GDSL-type esterase/lipase family protein [Sphingomonas sp.]MBX3594807.1 GDSL family lipase [Sphingomonas sp.]